MIQKLHLFTLKKFLDKADIYLVSTACYLYFACLCETLMPVGITETRMETKRKGRL